MKTLLLCAFMAISYLSIGQTWLYQYFDGADTIPGQSIKIEIDSASRSIWQIGPPQKTVFNSANSDPNVIVTDTLHNVPDSTYASWYFGLNPNQWQGGILAIQWDQKLDFNWDGDFAGILEYSYDTMQTWHNAFYGPDVYNFYGYNSINEGVYLPTSQMAFWGEDTLWRNIWLCFGYDFMYNIDTFNLRFTCNADTTYAGDQEGWMIDNLIVFETWFHTIAENSDEDDFTGFPTLADQVVRVKCDAPQDPPRIETVQIYDLNGRLVEEFVPDDVKFEVDVSNYQNGTYRMRIITDKGFDLIPFIVRH